ncbi:hypothetical protein M422DRAFT_45388 [Sphaerobolus stellatus SS14]|nr:hypothetical protein M422DRAFT_45388 [Sphaerobolus stellatus SS14]
MKSAGKRTIKAVVNHKAASETAIKAQTCFTESVRVMEPYLEEMSTEIHSDFLKIKELGLLQGQKIFTLIYGWQSKASGVRRSMELVLEWQKTTFACLTRVAVWLQATVPDIEAEVRTSRVVRDAARRRLVSLWNPKSSSEVKSPSKKHGNLLTGRSERLLATLWDIIYLSIIILYILNILSLHDRKLGEKGTNFEDCIQPSSGYELLRTADIFMQLCDKKYIGCQMTGVHSKSQSYQYIGFYYNLVHGLLAI